MPTPLRKRSPRWMIAPLLCAAVGFGCGGGGGGGGGGGNVPPAFTVHYHRALEDYAGWAVAVQGGAIESTAAATGTDGFGATYALTVAGGAGTLSFALAKDGQPDPAGTLTVDVSGTVREVWVFSGHGKAIPRRPPALPETDNQVVLYYDRPDDLYSGWGLHLWGDQAPDTQWGSPLQPKGSDSDLGLGFVIDLEPGGDRGNCPAGRICFIVHKGSEKDPGPDITSWDRAVYGDIVFLTSGIEELTTAPRVAGQVTISNAAAHLLSRDTLAWTVPSTEATAFELRYSLAADLAVVNGDVTGGTVIPLTPRSTGLTAAQKAADPQLAALGAFDVAAADLPKVEEALRGQLVAVARKADGKPVAATKVQTARAIDDLYAYTAAEPLGATVGAADVTFRLWAPTAQGARLVVADAATKAELAKVDLVRGDRGVWSYVGPKAWDRQYYRFELDVFHPSTGRVEHVTVTDPYAVNLSTNGEWAQVVNLEDADLKPQGWDALAKPALAGAQDVTIYELHVRDFSATDATVPAALRGKYLAFTPDADGATMSAGRAHLAAIAGAGISHLHVLPAFDVATIDEDPAARVDLEDDFARLCAKNPATPTALCGQYSGQKIGDVLRSLPGDSETEQEIATAMHGVDSFNWGYDPLHYGAPEGSYATTAEGTAKIVEFRRMVQGLAGLGLRTVMDVVYNHTNAAGLTDKSVLDKVVPGYYHRLDTVTGGVLSSTCCANTATEHVMMEKLMIDTLVRWAREYRIDGFRFDLMGHHMKANMLHVQAALAAVDPTIYLYGEGWDFGEVQANQRGVNATQLNMAGTGIGTFNDRLRDAVRGGSAFDQWNDAQHSLRSRQGFATGCFYDPNELGGAATAADLALLGDLTKIGMAGNLADFRLVKANGSTYPASTVSYNGAPGGYTQDPQEAINYVSKHDNQTLWDIAQYKHPTGTPMDQRVRAHDVAIDTVALGEGVPFFHAGVDLLRSKSMERDSYDSGDWFNRVDWTGQTTAFRSGVPNAGKDQNNWPLVQQVYADPSIAVGPAHVAAASAHFQEVLRVRRSSPLFRLGTKADVMTRVDFLNGGPDQLPGLIVMTISDEACAGADLDPNRDGVVVIVNANDAAQSFRVPGSAGATLHPVLAGSVDPVVKTATFDGATETFTVPGRTTVVYDVPQGSAGTLPCNTR